MSYVEGFVAAVPAASKDAYRTHAAGAAPMIREFGATRLVEVWGDDVPDGKVTDFRRSVQATGDEVVVFAWFEYPDRATRDAANAKMISDPRMKEIGASMPFDGQRMIIGGFATILDERTPGANGTVGYTDGFVVPVPTANKEAYRDMAAKAAKIFAEHGAIRTVEAWGDDIHDGKVTDFRRAVQAKADETVVFAWVEWPSRDLRNEGWKKVMADPRMQPGKDTVMPFDGQRLIYGGFAPLLDA